MDEHEIREKHEKYKERFVRWQQLTIQQLSYTNNLFIGLNLAFLGFLLSQTGLRISSNCLLFTIETICILAIGASFLTGILTVLYRLYDFRATHQLVKNRKLRFECQNNIGEKCQCYNIESKITNFKSKADMYGKKTWIFLQWQIWTFAIGVPLGIIVILLK